MAEVFTLDLGCLEYIGADLGIHLPTDAGPDTRRGPHAGRQGPGAEKGDPSMSRQTRVRNAGCQDLVRRRSGL